MKQVTKNNPKDGHALATGRADTHRLQALHSIYGPGTRRALEQAGIRPGMRVADLGCGSGTVTTLLAELVGPTGQVIGVDVSAAQLAQARELFPPGLSNVSFVEASATDTGLPRESFDLVYCCLLLLHLTEPEQALREMYNLLKAGGILVCEDSDLMSAGSKPPTVLNTLTDLWDRLGPTRELDYTLARRLLQMALAANFSEPDVAFNQPVVVCGENKRFLEWEVAEAVPAFLEAGLITEK